MATARKVTILQRGDIVKLLRSEIKKAGSQQAWANKNGIDRTFTNQILNGKKAPSLRIIRALGLSVVVIAAGNGSVVDFWFRPLRQRPQDSVGWEIPAGHLRDRVSRLCWGVPKLDPEYHLALKLLAGSADGCTEELMLAHGLSRNLLAQLIIVGFARADTDRVMAGGKSVDVRRYRITDLGQRVLK